MILYVAMVSVFILVITSFWGSINEINDRNQAISTVNTEAAFIINTVTETVRRASAITVPAVGGSGPILNLTMTDVALNPTVLTFASGSLTMQEGAGTAVNIGSNQITIDSLTFRNVSGTGTAGAVRIELTLSYKNTSGKFSKNYSQTFYDTATIRK